MTTALVSTGLKIGAGLLADKLSSKRNKQALAGLSQGPTSFQAGGIGAFTRNGTVSVGANKTRQGIVNLLSGQTRNLGGQLQGLRAQVRPGFSALRRQRLSDLENRRRKALGDIEENLQQRRVLGSSFGQDAVTRANLEFQQEADRISTESMIQELQLTDQLLQEEFAAKNQAVQFALDDLNLQTEIGAKLSLAANDVMTKNAQVKAALAAKSSEGTGRFLGNIATGLGKGLKLGSDGSSISGSGARIPAFTTTVARAA